MGINIFAAFSSSSAYATNKSPRWLCEHFFDFIFIYSPRHYDPRGECERVRESRRALIKFIVPNSIYVNQQSSFNSSLFFSLVPFYVCASLICALGAWTRNRMISGAITTKSSRILFDFQCKRFTRDFSSSSSAVQWTFSAYTHDRRSAQLGCLRSQANCAMIIKASRFVETQPRPSIKSKTIKMLLARAIVSLIHDASHGVFHFYTRALLFSCLKWRLKRTKCFFMVRLVLFLHIFSSSSSPHT